jgi:hypothetical protein
VVYGLVGPGSPSPQLKAVNSRATTTTSRERIRKLAAAVMKRCPGLRNSPLLKQPAGRTFRRRLTPLLFGAVFG